jgi:2,4-dienoyl-CoA reductase-like NADH-dependent reductase (Old Yellow Enzyme family)
VGPSPVSYGEGWPAPEALDQTGMETVEAAFVQATQRAASLNFDLVELHAAHGYLLHEFLFPLSNHRGNDYRIRFPLEVFAAMRAVWPDHKPLGARISAADYADGGWELADSIVLAGPAPPTPWR